MIPTISRYAESVSKPFGLFRTLNNLICERDVYGDPLLYSGGNSAVFKIWSAGKKYALKCHTRVKPSTKHIYRKLSTVDSGLLFRTKYLPGEIYVFGMDGSGEWFDAILSEWAEGATLEYEICKAIHYGKPEMFSLLASNFDKMALELLAEQWAHGDLKPGNISVGSDGSMKLLDYDAMFFPDIEYEAAIEAGTCQYQHPLRSSYSIGKYIDDYSIAIISATLHSLAVCPSAASQYGRRDIFLFQPSDIYAGNSKGHAAMKSFAAKSGDARLYRLLSMLESASPQIEGLKDIISFGNDSGQAVGGTELYEPYCKDGKWGYKVNGATVIPLLYDGALKFYESLAIVELGGYSHYINAAGKTVIDCPAYENVKSFSCGLAAVKHNGLWGYIDANGRTVIKPQFITAETFRDGEAVVTTKTGRKKTLGIEEIRNGMKNKEYFYGRSRVTKSSDS